MPITSSHLHVVQHFWHIILLKHLHHLEDIALNQVKGDSAWSNVLVDYVIAISNYQ